MTQGGFGDIPLFREIQRLLEAGGGPVNYEIARQIAAASAVGAPSVSIGPPDTQGFSQAVHAAEMMLSGYSRLTPGSPLQTQVVDASWWATSTLDAWRWLLDHLAGRFSEQLPGGDEGGPGAALGEAMGQIGPLLMGLQAGTLIGQLATEVISRYDVPVPRDDDGKLFHVAGTTAATASEYSIDPDTLVRWLALQEAARGLVVNHVPWLTRYWRALLIELADSIEIDVAGIERQLTELSSGGLEALQEGAGGHGIVPVVETERHRAALSRIQAFVATFEGYARHIAGAVSQELLGDVTTIEEAMSRRRLQPSDGRAMLSAMLGLSLDTRIENTGVTFCAAVTKLEGITSLNLIWDAPDNLPSQDEIKDPFTWMERVIGE